MQIHIKYDHCKIVMFYIELGNTALPIHCRDVDIIITVQETTGCCKK